ncbi:hypothetical protein [Paracidovorax citrulli]
MNATFRLILLSLMILVLPAQAASGSITALQAVCGELQAMPMAITPMMSRHAALKGEAEAALQHQPGAACHEMHPAHKASHAQPDAAGQVDDTTLSSADQPADSGCTTPCDACAVSAAFTPALPELPLSQFRHMLPRSPVGTLADNVPSSLLRPPSARC